MLRCSAMSPHEEEDEEITELPATWEELEELLRFPGHVGLEAFVWLLATRFNALGKVPKHAGPKTPRVALQTLVDALIGHYGLADDAAERAREGLTAGLLRVDLDFDENA